MPRGRDALPGVVVSVVFAAIVADAAAAAAAASGDVRE